MHTRVSVFPYAGIIRIRSRVEAFASSQPAWQAPLFDFFHITTVSGKMQV